MNLLDNIIRYYFAITKALSKASLGVLCFLFIVGINKSKGQEDPCADVKDITPINQLSFEVIKDKNLTYPFYFAVISDIHSYREADNDCKYSGKFTNFQTLLDKLNSFKDDKNNKLLSFVLSAGDLVSADYQCQYEKVYDEIIKKLLDITQPLPFFTIPGNHEFKLNSNKREYYTTYFDNMQDIDNSFVHKSLVDLFDFDYYIKLKIGEKYVLLFGINNIKYNKDLLLYQKQITFINNNCSGAEHIFTFSHAPILSLETGYDYYDFYSKKNYIQTLLAKKVRANFHGHTHEFHKFFKCANAADEKYPGLFDITVGPSAPNGTYACSLIDGTLVPIFKPSELQNKPNFLIVKVEEAAISVKTYFYENDDNKQKQFDFSIYGTDVIPGITIGEAENTSYYHLSPYPIETEEKTNAENIAFKGGSTTALKSMYSIKMNPGFTAYYGGTFEAKIIGCNDIEPQHFCEDENDVTYLNSGKKLIDSDSTVNTLIGDNIIINLYPNPSAGSFFLRFSGDIKDKTFRVYITDVVGKTVYNTEITNRELQEIDLSGKGKGMYFVSIKTEDYKTNFKIVINE
ncbi:MAG: metallophosphoesterase [Bacteroidales bacterium]|nr:metallophosphoesterase [Bacteroidales bacterium]